ncbi:peptidoglycan editing factor PgeF [Sulfurimonas sp.]|jgi:polyphenol oxidase|uniref:peptidoglycan editing factor PgeF n=1 Tax=Sulfurimonas sp. TaxID=2022749 RepID=UPI0025F0A3AA|nr:peptidoglycan editing factor PgeF [Sulfurimonas sp.]MBT5935305.1 peptidoglycan editing factor PgeF [Sulfurimonas sp.]
MKINQISILKQFTNITYSFTSKNDGNLAFHVNDDIDLVNKNHQDLAKKLNYDKNKLVHMKQVHSNKIQILTEQDNYLSPPTCDALITNKIHTPLMVMVADCAPILFYDDIKKVIAVAHAGRSGVFQNIVQTTLSSFINDFNSSIDNIYVAIGANIHSCCYEVGSEIYDEAMLLGLGYALQPRDNKYLLNINAILKKQLLLAGIDEKNIEESNECTLCKKDKYFSYRHKKDNGRFAGVIYLNN